MKILVVEDDLLVADSLLHDLEQLNYRVTAIAESYEDALKAIQKERPDLALLDIGLKGELTGIDLAAELSLLHIPFIYLTGIQDMSTYLRAKDTSPLKNLSKPIDLLNLRNALLEINLQSAASPSERISTITHKGIKERIDPEQIVYIKAGGSYCEIHLEDGSDHVLTSPMGTVVKKLAVKNLVPISRSCHINLRYVTKIRGNEVMMINDIQLQIAESYKAAFNRYLNPL